jgi:hypothetical protein
VHAHDLATAKYELQVLRVFCDAAGRFGNPLGEDWVVVGG